MTIHSTESLSFGALLKTFRTRRHLTQQRLAAALGVHRHTIGRWEQGDVLPASKTLVLELARHLRLDELETRQLLEASLTARSPHWLIPFPRNPFFTGREAMLETLHTHLSTHQVIALTQSYALHGLGGVGKTQIALEYAYRYALEYSAVLWIGAETSESILSSLLRIAEVLDLPGRDNQDQPRVIAAVQRWLTTHSQWLLIWDNVDDLALFERFLPSVRSGVILMTTRRQALGTLAQGLDLSPMEQEEGILFLLRRAKVVEAEAGSEHIRQLATQRSSQYAVAAELVMVMGRLPLALDQAGAYIEETGCSVSGYLQRYQQQRKQLLERRGAAEEMRGEHPHSVSMTFSLAYEQVKQQNPLAAELLCFCAFLCPDAIPEEMVMASIPYLGKISQPVAIDRSQLDQALAVLYTFSLIHRHAETHTLSIHRLVQAVVKGHLETATVQRWIERTLQAVNAVFPRPEVGTWLQCEQYIPHAQMCLQALEQSGISLPEAAQLCQKAGDYVLKRGRYTEVEPFLLHALGIQEQQCEPDPLRLATTLESLSEFYWRLNKEEQALAMMQRALALCEQQVGPNHPKTADCYNNLAVLYWNQGRYQQAKRLWEQALAIHEACFGEDHPETAQNLNNLAFVFRDQGDYQQAEELYQRVLAIRERLWGFEHPDTALALITLGSTYQDQGKYEQAESLLRRALTLLEQYDHPNVADSLGALGVLYQQQNKYELAEPLLRRALALHERIRGAEHTATAKGLMHLGVLYQQQSKYELAEPLLRRALSLYEPHQGAYADMAARCLMQLGVLSRKQGKDEEAEANLLRALALFEQEAGLDHPRTAESLTELARLYEQQEKDKQAEQMLCRALTIFEQRLGDAHPKTIATRALYIQLLQKQPGAKAEASAELIAKQREGLRKERSQAPSPTEDNPLQAFLAACCELHPLAWCAIRELWDSYERWTATEQRCVPLSRRVFAAQLKAQGCRIDRTSIARIWRGIRLVSKSL